MTSNTERLIGAWWLVSWEEIDSEGGVRYPLGPDAVGQISYEATGRMSAQLMRPKQSVFESQDWRRAAVEERAAAWSNYFGYFGSYRIDETVGAVVHFIEGSWFPNLVGTEQIRFFQFEGSRVTLNADTEWGNVRIVWEKIKGATSNSASIAI
jgi:Lipocalin-like domain